MTNIPEHNTDADCTLDDTNSCIICGVYHGEPCIECGGRGFHNGNCKANDTYKVTVELYKWELENLHISVVEYLDTMEHNGNFENTEHDLWLDLEARLASIYALT